MATLNTKITTCLKAFTKAHLLPKQKEFVFVISHMRARTTLLAHILDNSPEIVGSDELHLRYRNGFDEFKVRCIRVNDEGFSNARYICDNLLHNRLIINTDRYSRAKFIFMLREPEATLKSLLKRHLQNNGADTVGTLTDYYQGRLAFIADMWRNITPEQKLYINSDDLIINTAATLDQLQRFLGLKEPLTTDYQMRKNTGKSGHGDMSDNIKQGKIVKTENNSLNSEEAALFNSIFSSTLVENFHALDEQLSCKKA